MKNDEKHFGKLVRQFVDPFFAAVNHAPKLSSSIVESLLMKLCVVALKRRRHSPFVVVRGANV
jgi:hypothetical protein